MLFLIDRASSDPPRACTSLFTVVNTLLSVGEAEDEIGLTEEEEERERDLMQYLRQRAHRWCEGETPLQRSSCRKKGKEGVGVVMWGSGVSVSVSVCVCGVQLYVTPENVVKRKRKEKGTSNKTKQKTIRFSDRRINKQTTKKRSGCVGTCPDAQCTHGSSLRLPRLHCLIV